MRSGSAPDPFGHEARAAEAFFHCAMFWMCTIYICLKLANLHTAVACENIVVENFWKKNYISSVGMKVVWALSYGQNLVCNVSNLQFCYGDVCRENVNKIWIPRVLNLIDENMVLHLACRFPCLPLAYLQ